ncbi:hypothetical protein [Streptomyces canus]|uniref:hypothetical protein n=1 Tax=Streptomyces canus TaxID=58343 RepID=UPI0030E524AD
MQAAPARVPGPAPPPDRARPADLSPHAQARAVGGLLTAVVLSWPEPVLSRAAVDAPGTGIR